MEGKEKSKEKEGIKPKLEKKVKKEKDPLKKELLSEIAYQLINLGKEINIDTIINSLYDKEVPKETKIKILTLLGIPAESEIDKIVKFPEIKKKINESYALLKEEIKKIDVEEFDNLILKQYLKKIEDFFIGERLEKTFKKEGQKIKKVRFSPSKKFDVKETIKSFIKEEYQFYSKYTEDYKKANIVLVLDFSSSMKGKKIEELKKFVTFMLLFEEKRVKSIYLFNKDVKKANELVEILKETPKYNTNIKKALEEVNKNEKESLVFLITDNIPTANKEEEIIKEVEKLKENKNELVIILLSPKEESIKLAKKMSDKVLVLEGNYLMDLINFVSSF